MSVKQIINKHNRQVSRVMIILAGIGAVLFVGFIAGMVKGSGDVAMLFLIFAIAFFVYGAFYSAFYISCSDVETDDEAEGKS